MNLKWINTIKKSIWKKENEPVKIPAYRANENVNRAVGLPHGKGPSLQGRAFPYVRIKPLPKISLELVTRMKAWGSADFRYTRSATAWERDSAASTTHFASWE